MKAHEVNSLIKALKKVQSVIICTGFSIAIPLWIIAFSLK
jgi:tryptophan synthase alpha subunit